MIIQTIFGSEQKRHTLNARVAVKILAFPTRQLFSATHRRIYRHGAAYRHGEIWEEISESRYFIVVESSSRHSSEYSL